jgi:hypothetical protein
MPCHTAIHRIQFAAYLRPFRSRVNRPLGIFPVSRLWGGQGAGRSPVRGRSSGRAAVRAGGSAASGVPSARRGTISDRTENTGGRPVRESPTGECSAHVPLGTPCRPVPDDVRHVVRGFRQLRQGSLSSRRRMAEGTRSRRSSAGWLKSASSHFSRRRSEPNVFDILSRATFRSRLTTRLARPRRTVRTPSRKAPANLTGRGTPQKRGTSPGSPLPCVCSRIVIIALTARQ